MASHTVRLLFALLLTSGPVLGAATARAAAVGAILGVGRGGIGGDTAPNTEYLDKTGLLAGFQGEVGIARDISLSLQPMYVQRHSGVTVIHVTQASGQKALELALDYVAVPIVVKISAARGRTYVSSGVDIGYLTAARLSGEGLDEDVKASFNNVDVGALLGLGVVFPVGRPRLTAEVRYVQGLVDLAGDAAQASTSDLPERFHSDGFELTAGALIPLGRP